jgi:ribosomal protein L11 methyltransferase
VLDFGTGSGILAISAALLGASRVVAVDNDADAVSVAARNVAVNHVRGQVEVRQGSVEAAEEGTFDVVVTNLPSGLMVPLAPALARKARSGGLLIVSGFRSARAPMVQQAVAGASTSFREERAKDGWLGLVFQRTSTE